MIFISVLEIIQPKTDSIKKTNISEILKEDSANTNKKVEFFNSIHLKQIKLNPKA